MASIYKRSRKKGEPYWIQYLDHNGQRRTTKGFTNKELTEELAAKLEAEVRMRKAGMINPTMDRVAAQRLIPIDEQFAEFEESISDNSPQYVQLTLGHIHRIAEGCHFETLTDIDAEAVQKYLRAWRKAKQTGHNTYNK